MSIIHLTFCRVKIKNIGVVVKWSLVEANITTEVITHIHMTYKEEVQTDNGECRGSSHERTKKGLQLTNTMKNEEEEVICIL